MAEQAKTVFPGICYENCWPINAGAPIHGLGPILGAIAACNKRDFSETFSKLYRNAFMAFARTRNQEEMDHPEKKVITHAVFEMSSRKIIFQTTEPFTLCRNFRSPG
jgi:hypothetical protein